MGPRASINTSAGASSGWRRHTGVRRNALSPTYLLLPPVGPRRVALFKGRNVVRVVQTGKITQLCHAAVKLGAPPHHRWSHLLKRHHIGRHRPDARRKGVSAPIGDPCLVQAALPACNVIGYYAKPIGRGRLVPYVQKIGFAVLFALI